MLEILDALVTAIGLLTLEALRQRGEQKTDLRLQQLEDEFEQKQHQLEEMIRQLRIQNQNLREELASCWKERDSLQLRLLNKIPAPEEKS